MSTLAGIRNFKFAGAGLAFLWLSLSDLPGAALTNVRPGTIVVPPLTGQAATNQALLVEQLRHWPKKVDWELRTHVEPPRGAEKLRYLLFKPNDFKNGTNFPLVLSLHGGGPRKKFDDLLEPNSPGFAYGLGRLVCPETQTNHPCFVVAPWSDNDDWNPGKTRLVMSVLQNLQKEFHIDSHRIYITGQSMGGWGTWRMITQYPQAFAAAIPICGGGEPSDAPKAKAMPIWTLHGSADTIVPVEYTRNMILALQRVGAKPTYWEYKGATHADTAERAYCEPELIEWMFAQTKP